MRAEPPVPPEVMAAIRAPFLDHGAALIDPPVIQPLNLLLDLTGETMRGRLFVVQDEGGREACLRPDFTMAVANAHVQGGGGLGLYRYEGKAFRVSPPHSAHAEEFTQIGLEGFGGPAGPAVDAGLAVLAWKAASAGGRDDLVLRLGDIALFDAFLNAIAVEGATAARLRRSLASPRALASELVRAQAEGQSIGDNAARFLLVNREDAIDALETLWSEGQIAPVGGRTAGEIIDRLARRQSALGDPRLTGEQARLIERYAAMRGEPREILAGLSGLVPDPAFQAAISGWNQRLDVLAADGAPADRTVFDAGFGRAFSYYDGFLFEITSAALDADAPVAAGGRYDALLARLSGQAGTAVGCIVRPARAWTGGAA